MNGLLKKCNSHGLWQKRYFYLNNDYLVYLKESTSKDIKGVFDLAEIVSLKKSSTATRFMGSAKSSIELSTTNGETLELQCSNDAECDKWIQCIQERMVWCREQLGTNKTGRMSLTESSLGSVYPHTNVDPAIISNDIEHISGWLMKKSHNKYLTNLQERFVRVKGDCLRYYKAEIDEADLGMINLESATVIRPYDDSEDCTTFEIQAHERYFFRYFHYQCVLNFISF